MKNSTENACHRPADTLLTSKVAKNQLSHVKIPCPISGMTFGTKQVERHFCTATLCKDGATIHFYCMLHLIRGFVKHPQILEMLNGKDRKAQAHSV